MRAVEKRRYLGLGLGLAILVFVFDQLSKTWIVQSFWPSVGCDPFLYSRLHQCRYEILPFMDFTMAWNKGVSYGLFTQESDLGRWLLFAFAVVAALGFLVWLFRSQGVLLAVSIGLIIGGALGNGIDRMVYGAVADFVSLHAFGIYWYIFNVADIAIVAGAAGLLYDIVLTSRKTET